MRHPIDSCNQQQASILASLPQAIQLTVARQFRIYNASYCYQARVGELFPAYRDETISLPGEMAYYEGWRFGLPADELQRLNQAGGFKEAIRTFSFRRYVLEHNDIGYDEYLKQHLSVDDYQFHRGMTLGELSLTKSLETYPIFYKPASLLN